VLYWLPVLLFAGAGSVVILDVMVLSFVWALVLFDIRMMVHWY